MNILITGANGFVGRNVKEYFEKNKIYNVFAPNELELDLTDFKNVDKFFVKNSIDCIIHSATVLQVNKEYVSDVCEQNLKMFFNLCKCKSKDTKLINLGSGSEYSREHWISNMNESYFDNHIPQDSHSFSKYIMAKYIESSKDSNLLHLRIFGIFGKYEDYRNKFISNCIAKNLMNLPIIINQNAYYDYLFIDDFSKIVEKLISSDVKNKILNITPTKSTDLISINNQIQKNLNIDTGYKLLNKGYGKEYTGDNTGLINCLGGFEFMTMEESISKLLFYYSSNISLINREDLTNDKFLEYAKKINPRKN
jgi:UDP-glucose 4-epimerase